MRNPDPDEIECVERDGVFEPVQQKSEQRDWGFEVLFWFFAALALINLIAYDIATGRLADPFKIFGGN